MCINILLDGPECQTSPATLWEFSCWEFSFVSSPLLEFHFLRLIALSFPRNAICLTFPVITGGNVLWLGEMSLQICGVHEDGGQVSDGSRHLLARERANPSSRARADMPGERNICCLDKLSFIFVTFHKLHRNGLVEKKVYATSTLNTRSYISRI